MNFLNQYLNYEGITKSILGQFNVEVYNENSQDLQVIYSYLDGSKKICNPYSSNSNEKWRIVNPTKANQNPNIFGFDKLPEKGNLIVITSREIDVMALYSLEIPAICFSSVDSTITERVFDKMKKRFEDLIILFSSDETGIRLAEVNSKEFLIPYSVLPIGKYGKDLTDFLSLGRTKTDIENILQRGISRFYRRTQYYQAGMLSKMKFFEEDYVIPGILQTSSLGALIGGSDSGKSLLALQFSISYVLGNDFLGQKLNGGKKALYFSLEDSQGSIARRFEKLTSKFSQEQKDLINNSLFFSHEKESIENLINHHLIDFPDTGLVIIDTFSEIASGKDINNSGEVRKILRPFHQICQLNEIAIIIIHHIGKASDKEGKMSKLGIVGSQSFEASMRLVIQMNKPSEGKYEIGIVKGNDIDENLKSWKSKTYLSHSSETLWFSKNNYSIDLAIKDDKKVDWQLIFGENNTLKTSEIKSLLLKEYKIEDKAAEKLVGKELGEFRLKLGFYSKPVTFSGVEEEDDFEL